MVTKIAMETLDTVVMGLPQDDPFSTQFVPFRKIGRRQLKEILRRAATSDSSDKERSFKVNSTLKEI